MQIDRARVLIIATDGFEQSELFDPRIELKALGAQVTLAAPEQREIQGMEHDKKGATITADHALDDVSADDFDALLIPGGVANPDALRQNEKAVQIVRDFFAADKPVAAICHGPWMLVEADVARGRTVTSWPSVRTDLKNAGAEVVDREVVVDGKLITSRKPADIPAFTKALVDMLEKEEQGARPTA